MNLYFHCVIYGNGTCISKYIVACFVLYIVMPGVLPWAVKTCPGGSSLIVIHTYPSGLKIVLNDSKMTLKHSLKNLPSSREITNFEKYEDVDNTFCAGGRNSTSWDLNY